MSQEPSIGPQSRKRTRRACDKCSSSRARCDGQCPCRRCQEYGHACQYNRDLRKRGRKPGFRLPATASGDQVDDTYAPNGGGISTHTAAGTQSPPDQLNELGDVVDHEDALPQHDSLRSKNFPEQPGTENNVSIAPAPDFHGASPIAPSRAAGLLGPIIHSPTLPLSTGLFDSGPSQDLFGQTPQTPVSERRPSTSQVSGTEVRAHRPYKCLQPLLPLLEGIIDADEACELLEFYFAQPGSSLFKSASPYILSHVFRKRSLLHPTKPRRTTPALTCTMLWVSAQTADIPHLLLPGQRNTVCEALRKLCMRLVQARDLDCWERLPGGKLVERYPSVLETTQGGTRNSAILENEPPENTVDDVLTFILICIVISGSDFKTDCQVWWNKAVRLMYGMGLNRQDMTCSNPGASCLTTSCRCRQSDTSNHSLESLEAQEESRRVFWLLFCLDRHLALSYNSTMCIGDDECQVYTPLPEDVWNNLESAPLELLTLRAYGPPTLVTGTGLFDWFLPLMTILGDVIHVHHRKLHPRFGSLADEDAVSLVEASLDNCARSIGEIENRFETGGLDGTIPASEFLSPSSGYQDTPFSQPFDATASYRPRGRAQAQLVTVYGTFILHVLHVLLHGKWDAVSMLENDDGWITSVQFMKCASHAISASEAVSQILRCDPELTFMPYLFGIYLLHGSFILLLFADRMPQLGPNKSVETACETIIRAHEVCVVTLSTEFQKRFRKVLRSTLYSVRSAGATNAEESKARRRALSLYRWSKGSRGLAL
ncbi:hypothetical protein PV08_02672 [Exophiala spinifera]|uniref:Xylanolytic transcriptional activator xlnR n=1 Tax=Exophiala spinifera TaxID=91928 RepID=A0A0D2C431_9EURO|nr:uncharacterized protein PV08_02672 [Exophiala spinifera]KIW18384.1 hypothetical protein PV08_02672 [Exophiala spinifera]